MKPLRDKWLEVAVLPGLIIQASPNLLDSRYLVLATQRLGTNKIDFQSDPVYMLFGTDGLVYIQEPDMTL